MTKALLKLACEALFRANVPMPPLVHKWYRAQLLLGWLKKKRLMVSSTELTIDMVQEHITNFGDIDL